MKSLALLVTLASLALLPGCDGAPLTACIPVGADLSGTWQVSFANQDPSVVWQLSQCAADVRGSETRNQALAGSDTPNRQVLGIQGSLKGSAFSVIRTPRSRTDGLDYAGQLISDTRIEGTFTGTQGQTAFTAIKT